jgi:hypothetical protein
MCLRNVGLSPATRRHNSEDRSPETNLGLVRVWKQRRDFSSTVSCNREPRHSATRGGAVGHVIAFRTLAARPKYPAQTHGRELTARPTWPLAYQSRIGQGPPRTATGTYLHSSVSPELVEAGGRGGGCKQLSNSHLAGPGRTN